MKNIFIVIITMLLMASCSSKSDRSSFAGTTTISVDEPTKKVRYEFVKRIPLKLEGEDVIGSIGKIIYMDNRFYVHDRRQNLIWQFDKDGTLKNKLAAIGPGPGEYVAIQTFDVTDEGLLYVLDSHGRKVNAYDVDNFDFKFSIPTKNLILDLGVANKENLFAERCIVQSGNHIKLGKFGKEDPELKAIMKYDHNGEDQLTRLNPFRFYRSGNDLIYYDRFSDAIYSLDGDSLKQVLTVKSSRLPNNEQIENLISKKLRRNESNEESKISHIEKNDIVLDISNIYFTPSYIYMSLQTHPLTHLFIDRKTNEVATLAFGDNFAENFKRCIVGALGTCEDNFITRQAPENEHDDYALILFKMQPVD